MAEDPVQYLETEIEPLAAALKTFKKMYSLHIVPKSRQAVTPADRCEDPLSLVAKGRMADIMSQGQWPR